MTTTFDYPRADLTFPIGPDLAARFSPRAFADRPISDDILGSMLEAARWAPSSRNEQPWRFLLARKDQEPAAYAALLDSLKEGNQAWAQTAPLLGVGIARTSWSDRETPNKYAWYDVGQAIAYFTIEAQRHGVYLRQMGGFYPERVMARFAIPAPYTAVVAFAAGHLGAPERLPEPLRAREGALRSRHPLQEVAFAGAWNNPIPLATP
jgi:nitroreductase